MYLEDNKLILEKKDFDNLKNNDVFIFIVSLGRFLNALISSNHNFLESLKTNTIVGKRQKFASVWISIGFLHEGISLFRKYEKKFGNDPIFQKTIGKLINDEETIKSFQTIVEIRNNQSFHFGKIGKKIDKKQTEINKFLKQTMNKMDSKEYVFVAYDGGSLGETYFEFSDCVNAFDLVKAAPSEIEKIEIYEKIFADTASLIKDMTQAVTFFIDEHMEQLLEGINQQSQ